MTADKTINEIEKQVERLNEMYIEEVGKSVLPPPPNQAFESFETKKRKAVLEAKNSLSEINSEVQKGMQLIMKFLKEKHPSKYDGLKVWFDKNKTNFLEALQSTSAVTSRSNQKPIPIPETFAETIDEIVTYFIDNNQFDEAANVMLICVSLKPQSLPDWIKYSSILQRNHDDIGALYALQIALALNSNNPFTYAHIARSWVALKQPKEAQENLKIALHFCEGVDECENLIDYCKALNAYCEVLANKAA